MEISPRELRDVEIKAEIRGYSRDEVNDLLDKAAGTIESLNERVNQLTERLSSAQTEAGRTRETEDILHRTLLLAQRAADEAVAEATAKSRQMLDDAEIQSRRLVADSEADALRKGEAERRRLEEEILDLAGRRDALLADVEALTRFEAEYRERMVRALEADLFALRSRPTSAPGTRPEPTEVEMPVLAEGIAPSAAPIVDTPFAPEPAMTATYIPDAPAEPEPTPYYAEAPSASTPIIEPQPQTSPPSIPQPLPEASNPSASTHEVDVRSLFEQHQAAAPPAPVVAPPAPVVEEPKQGLQPIDLLANDGADADVLDDDAFFATLRDAVHDDAPLGPRDPDDEITGDNRFFDQDADRGSFRDVFRRRR